MSDPYVSPPYQEPPDYWEDKKCCGNCKKCFYMSTDENGRIWCDLKAEWIDE